MTSRHEDVMQWRKVL